MSQDLTPIVSIIIPVHNRWDLTGPCLDSVFDCTSISFEVIVVDDASTDETPENLKKYGPRIRVIRNEARRSFSENNNQAAKIARGKYLCLLNNDTWVTPGWLEGMIEVAEREAFVGVIGNKHLFPKTHLLHHCGMAVTKSGEPLHLHPHTDPSLPAANYERDLQMVTFACCLIPRDWFEKLGGLSEEFRNGFEDCDFCLRTRKAGRRIIYTPASVIYHYGQSTPGRKVTDSANWETFKQKWGGEIQSDLERITKADQEFNDSVIRAPRRKTLGQEGIHLAVDISQGSALSWVVTELALALDTLGEKVSIPKVGHITDTIDASARARLMPMMSETPRRTFQVKLNHYWTQFLNQELTGEVNAELFVTNYRFRGEIQPLDMWSRNLLLSDYKKLPMSRFCQESLEDLGVPAKDCAIVAPGYSPEIDRLFSEPKKPVADPRVQLLVVTNSHDLSRYGTDILIPALAEAFSKDDPVVVHIKDYGSGSGSNELRNLVAAQKQFPNVVWHEQFVSKEALLTLYGEMDALVSPFRGEGYAMKIIDAMAIGLPVLMPAFGGPMEYAKPGTFIPLEYDEVPMGHCYDTEHYLVGPGAYWCEVRKSSLVSALKMVVERRDEVASLGLKAREHVLGKYTWENAAKSLVKALRGWQAEAHRKTSLRRRPATLRTSVVIPTKDRPIELEKTLQAYTQQTVEPKSFEIVLVNDHGDSEKLRALTRPFENKLQIRVVDNHGKNGPGAARNLGIELADGEIIFITGDDIIPATDLLEQHDKAHRKFPEVETAFVGYNDWHSEMQLDWVTKHIVGAGAQQFNYNGMTHEQEVPFDRFYTSNVSFKRLFTADMDQIFSENFRFAAFEDTELGYRLSKRGMSLRYLANAIGYHLHPMTARSFFERMRKVGCMLTVLSGMRPGFVPRDHTEIYTDLELERRRRAGAKPENVGEVLPPQLFLEPFIKAFEASNQWVSIDKTIEGAAKQYIGSLNHRLTHQRNALFDNLCDAHMRIGQAQEWAGSNPELAWAPGFVAMLQLPALGLMRGNFAQVPIPARAVRMIAKINYWTLKYESTRRLRTKLRGLKRFVPAELYR